MDRTDSARDITAVLREHYAQTFSQYGATSRGVDWGEQIANQELRYSKMLDVIPSNESTMRHSFLDVGCGYGGLASYAKSRGYQLEYFGIDVVPEMIAHARDHVEGTFACVDVFDYQPARVFDFVACNGILTQKMAVSRRSMDRYCHDLVRRLFDLCGIGTAFNVMTNKVNFMVENLYYRSPVELLSFCLDALTTKVRIDHAYPLYEFTMYLYQE